jgi:hypothetical protein
MYMDYVMNKVQKLRDFVIIELKQDSHNLIIQQT